MFRSLLHFSLAFSHINSFYFFRKQPSVLEFSSYTFSFHGLMCGPFCFYKDYIAFIEGTNYNSQTSSDATKTVGFYSCSLPAFIRSYSCWTFNTSSTCWTTTIRVMGHGGRVVNLLVSICVGTEQNRPRFESSSEHLKARFIPIGRGPQF